MAFKIYTKTGDAGQTSLIGGTKVSKAHIRIEAYGATDELIAHLGLCKDLIPQENIKIFLTQIQDILFAIGSILACCPEKNIKIPIPDIEESDIAALEKSIDEMELELPTLKNFIIPGGDIVASHIHICRCVCRRAERSIAALNIAGQPVDALVIKYINRLSDYLFVLSRHVCKIQSGTEQYWKPNA